MPARSWKTFRCLLGLAVLAGAGCSRGPALAEVSGTVRLKGKPVAKAMEEFLPDPEKGTNGPNSVGYTDEQGRYTLATSGGVPGAVVGSHRVLVRDESIVPEGGRGAVENPKLWGKRRWSDRYEDVRQTPLHKEVKPGPPQTIDLEVTGSP